MGKELENYKLERTVISQAHEITDLRESNVTWIKKYQEAEKKYQAEKEKSDRHGSLIHAIGQISNDLYMSEEEKIERIQTLVNQWEDKRS